MSRTAADLLAEARSGLRRLTPVVPHGSGQVMRAIAGGPDAPLPGTYA